ncbi:MAG: glycosyltransferase family 2 protein, partial [Patescibacteria group bacterium]
MFPKVAIIYLSFHSDLYLDDFVSALKSLTYPKDRLEVVIVDNPHPEYGSSVRAIEEKVMILSEKEIPRVTLLPQKENLGFSAGNNAGARWAIANGCQYIYFHNDDGFLAHDAIRPLVEAMERDRTIAIAQSLLLLFPDTEYINSVGNAFHYLGFGFCEGYRTMRMSVQGSGVRDIGYASGAGMMARTDLFQKHGGWDDDFFMYHEDVELSLRMRLLGYRVVMVPSSLFYHKYQFH